MRDEVADAFGSEGCAATAPTCWLCNHSTATVAMFTTLANPTPSWNESCCLLTKESMHYAGVQPSEIA